MSSIFDNANVNVTRHSFAPKSDKVRKIDIMSDTMLANQALRNIHAKEQQIIQEANERADLERENEQDRLNKCYTRMLTESQMINAIDTYQKTCKEYCFKSILTELYAKSLLIDDDFVNEHANDIKTLISDYVDSRGGMKLLDEAISRTDSNLLKKIKNICVETASEVSKRKIKEAQDTQDVSILNFTMTEDEHDKFEYKKTEISPDEIAGLVKDKVLTVIKDEKNRQEREDELKTAIEEELKNDEEVVDTKTAKEALSRIIIGKSVVENTTLFNAIFRNACNEAFIMNNDTDSTSVDNTSDDINTTEDDINDYAPMNDENYDKKEIDMDKIFTEAVSQYTLMEMLNTLKLEEYSHNNIKSLIGNLIKPIERV